MKDSGSDSDSNEASSNNSRASNSDAYSLVSSYDAEVACKHEENETVKAKKIGRLNQVAHVKKSTASFAKLAPLAVGLINTA